MCDLFEQASRPDRRLFKMPVVVAVFDPGQTKPQMKIVQADSRSNLFSISVTGEPERVVLDPDMWILMDADFKKN